MLTDEKIKEMAQSVWPYAEQPFIDGYKAAREEMMKDNEELKSKFFAKFGFGQCNAIWEFFAPHLTDNGK